MGRIQITLLLLLCSFAAMAQRGTFFSMLTQQGNACLLDGNSAKAAYSLRQLKTGVTVAIRVRRSNDNTEQDIGFINGQLDTSSLKAFAGSNSAYVVYIYDQSGNGQTASQTTVASQSLIVNAGVINRDNGKPSMLFDGVNDYYTVTSSTAYFKFLHDGTTASYIFSAQRFGIIANPNAAYTLLGNTTASTSYGIQYVFDDRSTSSRNNGINGAIYRGVSGAQTATYIPNDIITPNVLTILTGVFDAGNVTVADRLFYYVNNGTAQKGNLLANSAATNNASFDMNIGRLATTGLYLSGTVSEIIIFGTDQSSRRTTILNNINSYYGAY